MKFANGLHRANRLNTWGREMEYIDCLDNCIDQAEQTYESSNIPIVVKMYRSYPIPSEKEWSKCLELGDTYPICGSGGYASFLDYMAQYEVILSRKGIPTVSEKRAVAALIGLAVEEGVHLFVMLNALDRLAAGLITRVDICGTHLN